MAAMEPAGGEPNKFGVRYTLNCVLWFNDFEHLLAACYAIATANCISHNLSAFLRAQPMETCGPSQGSASADKKAAVRIAPRRLILCAV